MKRGGIGHKGKTNIRFINAKLKKTNYVKVLNEEITANGKRISGKAFILQCDNASVHPAKVVTKYFQTSNIQV